MKDSIKAKQIWALTRGHRLKFLLAIIAMACAYVLMFRVVLAAKFAIDIIQPLETDVPIPWSIRLVSEWWLGENVPDLFHYLILAALVTIGMTAIAGGFLYLRGRLTALGSEGIARQLRNRIFTHLEHLPAHFHDSADTGDLVQRCTSDMETLRVFLSAQIVEISRALLMLIVVLPVLFSLDTRMAWLSLAAMPLLFLFAFVFFQKVKGLFLQVDESEAEMTTTLQENLTGIRVVRAFARQDHEIEKFAEKNAAFRNNNMKLTTLLGFYYGISDLLCMGQMGVLLLVGGVWVMDGSLTVGTLFAFLTYVGMVIWPVRHLGRVLTDSGKAIVAMGRMGEILNEPVESQATLLPTHKLSGDIRFDAVSFQFLASEPVLNNISLHIRPGETLGIVGAPGSGKSTITQLLLRLYDYDSGSITLDGMELADLNRKYVRSQISIVQQDPFLYSATIGTNLQIGRPDASREEVIQAAKNACVHKDITGFPNGYDSLVGERGVTLSGGQRQRLALARALLKSPPILILDDSLSAVDTETEAAILENMKSNRDQQTTIIVAHRLSSMLHADKIIVLKDGQIDQVGSHVELISQTGIYQRLCKIQGAIQQQLETDIQQAGGS